MKDVAHLMLKPFSVILSIDIIVSERRLFTETMQKRTLMTEKLVIRS